MRGGKEGHVRRAQLPWLGQQRAVQALARRPLVAGPYGPGGALPEQLRDLYTDAEYRRLQQQIERAFDREHTHTSKHAKQREAAAVDDGQERGRRKRRGRGGKETGESSGVGTRGMCGRYCAAVRLGGLLISVCVCLLLSALCVCSV